MKMNIKHKLIGLAVLAFSANAFAVPCSNPDSGIFLNDGTTKAWSTCQDGAGSNDPFPGSLNVGGMDYTALQKYDWVEDKFTTQLNINLTVTPSGAAPSGTWAFDPIAGFTDYVIVLKDGGAYYQNDGPIQWAAYVLDSSLFGGTTWSGTWVYGDNERGSAKAISHLSVYGKRGTIPEPNILALIGGGIVALGLLRRRVIK